MEWFVTGPVRFKLLHAFLYPPPPPPWGEWGRESKGSPAVAVSVSDWRPRQAAPELVFLLGLSLRPHGRRSE